MYFPGEKFMRLIRIVLSILVLQSLTSVIGICQLRNMSEYNVDRINTDRTHFVLHDSGEAEFVWSSEWTTATAYANDDKDAIVIWIFKDGTKAYSKQGDGVGEFGKTTGYLITDQSSTLEDIHGGKIQPLTLENYPVKVELWIGEIVKDTGYSPEVKGDEACFNAPGIRYNISYNFSGCPPSAS
jgi:hypothetical protein